MVDEIPIPVWATGWNLQHDWQNALINPIIATNINNIFSNSTVKNNKTYNIGEMFKYKPLSKYQGLYGKIPVRAPTTFVGVEIELEQVKYRGDLTNSTWKSVEDGSLKENGREFVSTPIPVKYMEVELRRLFNSILSCHISVRCSTHIHLNVRDFTLQELEKFMMLYLIFERSLYRFSGDRWNNNFCVPVQAFPHYLIKFFTHIKEGGILEEWRKYYGLNISPIFGGESSRIGTIEFRQMEGMSTVEHIMDWINLIVSLKIAAKSIQYDDLIEHVNTMNTTSAYTWLATQVFKFSSDLIIKQPTFKEDVEGCITKLKQIIIKQEVHNEILYYKGRAA